jgi:hypothetical protein
MKKLKISKEKFKLETLDYNEIKFEESKEKFKEGFFGGYPGIFQ